MQDNMVVAEVAVDDTRRVLIPVIAVETVDETDTTSEVSVLDKLRVEDLIEPVRQLGERIHESLGQLSPTTVTLEVGVAAGVKNGKITALLVEGKADVALKVTLTWDRASKTGSSAGDVLPSG